jgi:hypothetical protein
MRDNEIAKLQAQFLRDLSPDLAKSIAQLVALGVPSLEIKRRVLNAGAKGLIFGCIEAQIEECKRARRAASSSSICLPDQAEIESDAKTKS